MFNRKQHIDDAYIEERLSDYIDGTLSAEERAIVENYLATNERARASFEALRYTVQLLNQTPAPTLPRQFTLPVTSRAPAPSTPSWLVWGLRGVAVAATAAFVILLTATIVRQPNANDTVLAPAMAPALPSGVIALAPTPLPTFGTLAQDAAPATEPTREILMVTVEAPTEALETAPVLASPEAANKALPTQAPVSAQNNVPPPTPTQQPSAGADSNLVEPTSVPPTASANAAGANNPTASESLPATVTATAQAPTQRTLSANAIEGKVIVDQLRVRRGPGVEYRSIGGLKRGETVMIIGRTLDSFWLAIDYPKNLQTGIGWVGALYIQTAAPMNTLPIFEAPDILKPTETTEPDTATPTPESETTEPTETPTGN